jgi:hypothetical protein
LSPVIEAAWIAVIPASLAVITAAIVSLAGYRNARQVATATIEAAHNARLWEKRAAAYEDAVREVLARRARREDLANRDAWTADSKWYEEYHKAWEPEGIRVRAALRPYASAEAWTAYQAADGANTAFWIGQVEVARAIRDAIGHGLTDAQQRAVDALRTANDAADDADEAFLAVISRELAWRAPAARG